MYLLNKRIKEMGLRPTSAKFTVCIRIVNFQGNKFYKYLINISNYKLLIYELISNYGKFLAKIKLYIVE